MSVMFRRAARLAGKFQRAAERGRRRRRAPVADVREVIDGRPATIQPIFSANGSSGANSWTERDKRVEQF